MHMILVFVLSLCVIAVLAAVYFLIRKRMGSNGFITLLIYVFSIIFLFRMCVNIYMESKTLGIFETIMDSFVHTLQSFSMDEDYTKYVEHGKAALSDIAVCAEVYGIIISILNVMAPILGGAVILDILIGIFPTLKIIFNPRRNKFIFSELNINSITLAEDILRDSNYLRLTKNEDKIFFIKRKPLIIFTDAYPNSSSEHMSELFERAKAIRAICVNTDIKHLSVQKSKSVFYFLIDEDEHENLEAVNDLLIEPGSMLLWPKHSGSEDSVATTIIVFCQNDFSVNLVNNILKKKEGMTSQVLVRPIRDYSNMAMNLVREIPLFTALGDRVESEQEHTGISEYVLAPKKNFHVTLVGSGSIAEEIFKTVYWCGQMAGYQLYLHVISKTAKDMKDRIKHDCPDLFRSCDPQDDILKLYAHCEGSKYAPPYAICKDFIDTIDAEFIQDYPNEIITDTDYFIVALGSDEKNIHIATLLSEEIQRRHLEDGKNTHPVIVPIVFDNQLAYTLKNCTPGKYEPYYLPYGTIRERYSFQNIFMADTSDEAKSSGELYNLSNQKKRVDDEYKYWANIAKTIHAPYKLFSLSQYLNIPISWELGKGLQRSRISVNKSDANDMILSWMEHRRWNAFLRSSGFCRATDSQLARIAADSKDHDHKSVSLKLHSCLVEADIGKYPLTLQQIPIGDPSQYDNLDLVSIYDYLIEKVLSDDKYDSADLEIFFNKKRLLFERNEGLAKYCISLDDLINKEYKHYDGTYYDAKLKNLVVYND